MTLIAIYLLTFLGCGGDDTGSDDSKNLSSCAETCTQSDGGPPANDCLLVNAEEACVYTCTTDADCLEPFYSGCTSTTDDGTTICTINM